MFVFGLLVVYQPYKLPTFLCRRPLSRCVCVCVDGQYPWLLLSTCNKKVGWGVCRRVCVCEREREVLGWWGGWDARWMLLPYQWREEWTSHALFVLEKLFNWDSSSSEVLWLFLKKKRQFRYRLLKLPFFSLLLSFKLFKTHLNYFTWKQLFLPLYKSD